MGERIKLELTALNDYVSKNDYVSDGISHNDDCPDCYGSSWEIQFVKPCKKCKGTGKINKDPIKKGLI